MLRNDKMLLAPVVQRKLVRKEDWEFAKLKDYSCEEVLLALGTHVAVTPQHLILKDVIDNSELASNGVIYTHIGGQNVIVDSETGRRPIKFSTLNEIFSDDGNILAKPFQGSDIIKVYNGQNHKFDFKDIKSVAFGTRSENRRYPSTLLSRTLGGKQVEILNHHIVYGLVYGYDVLLALGTGHTHDIHHIWGWRAGNWIGNLQLLLHEEHTLLTKWLRSNKQEYRGPRFVRL